MLFTLPSAVLHACPTGHSIAVEDGCQCDQAHLRRRVCFVYVVGQVDVHAYNDACEHLKPDRGFAYNSVVWFASLRVVCWGVCSQCLRTLLNSGTAA